MAHGGYGGRRIEERRPLSRRSKGSGVDKKRKRPKSVSLKNQIRSTERFLSKDLPDEVRQAQKKKLEELKHQVEVQIRLALEQKIRLKDRKIKFFERRKIERMIRRLEKQQRASSDASTDKRITEQLSKLREDLEYVKFFPKAEKYVSLFAGGDDSDIISKRNKLRDQIKYNLVSAAANGKDLEETASDDDALDLSEDDFFLSGSSSDEAEADDEWTDKSAREPASSASGRATSGMSSDEKNQRQISARVLMPPPQSLPPNRSQYRDKAALSNRNQYWDNAALSNRSQYWDKAALSNRSQYRDKASLSTSSNTSNSGSGPSARDLRAMSTSKDQHGNLSSISDAQKPHKRRRRRPKKKQG